MSNINEQKLRELAESHAELVGLSIDDLASWFLECSPGFVIALLDRIAALRAALGEACDIAGSALNQIDESDDGVRSNVYTASNRITAIRREAGLGEK
jgi:hypothetical protein